MKAGFLKTLRLLIVIVGAVVVWPANAQQPQQSTGTIAYERNKPLSTSTDYDRVLSSTVERVMGSASCFERDESLSSIRTVMEREPTRLTTQARFPTPDELTRAFLTQYPCPFSPYRKEVRSAAQKDLVGVWIYPAETQKFRYPPRSNDWQANRIVGVVGGGGVTCEGVGLYGDGEMRTARIVGDNNECSIKTSKDMDYTRRNPRVASWKMSTDGRVDVLRADVPNHVEQWEFFSVENDFVARNVQFKKGELIAYLRKSNGNDWNVAQMFWHLRKLSD